MQHMRDAYDFAPSKRAFQTQFRKWEFPSKQNPAHRNVDLVSRVKELWEQNYSQRDMLKTLNDEGYEIKERELMRVRAKNRWLLRIPNGSKATPAEELFQAQLLEVAGLADTETTELPEEIARKRKERHDQLQAESDERWASKKRRRRTRDYAGIAADPPGPPRFPSETTLAEGMEFLGLDKKQYKEARERFQKICEDMEIIKKTLAGTDKWAAAKNRLIQELPYLTVAFADGKNLQAKELSLDVICTDVTKRMRTVERRMTIVDSKNVLGLNPEQSRQIRNGFYAILQANHFISKLETGHDHWQDLKDQWISKTPLLQEVLAAGDIDPQYNDKKKAIEVLCRDVMKRLRDDQKRKGQKSNGQETSQATEETQPLQLPMSYQTPQIDQQMEQSMSQLLDSTNFQIDPSLLQNTGFTLPDISNPTAVYVRPHPKSDLHANEKMWLGTLGSRSVSELQSILVQKWPDASISRIDGVERGTDGREVSYLIEEDEELDAYLDHVNGRKASFVVLLNHR